MIQAVADDGFIADKADRIAVMEKRGGLPASLQYFGRGMIPAHHIHRNSHRQTPSNGPMREPCPKTYPWFCESGLLIFHLQRQLGIDIPAIVAGAMGQLGVGTLRTADVMNRPQRVMRTPLTLAGLADFHDRLHARTPGRGKKTAHP